MSSKTHFSKFILALFLTFCFSNSFAIGLGLSSGSGSEEWDDNDLSQYHDGDREVSNFGFVLDTNTAKNRVFNYRFSLLAEENTADGGFDFLDMEGIAMTHDFGFSVFRNKVVRLWLGPQLKVGFYGDLSTDSSNTELDGDVVGFNFGPAFGVNIHLPKVVTFSLTYSYYIIGFYGGEYDVSNSFFGYVDTYDVDTDSTGSVLTASILFRIRDDY